MCVCVCVCKWRRTLSSAEDLCWTADLSSHISESMSPLLALMNTRDGSPADEMLRNVPAIGTVNVHACLKLSR